MAWKVAKRRKGRHRRFHFASQGVNPEGWAKLNGDKRTITGPRHSAIHNKKSSMHQPLGTGLSNEDALLRVNTDEVIVSYLDGLTNLSPRMTVGLRLSRRRVQQKYMGEKEFNYITLFKGKNLEDRLYFQGDCFVLTRHTTTRILVSHTHGSRERALRLWDNQSTRPLQWDETKTITLEQPPAT